MKNDALVRIYTRPLFDLAVENKSIESIAAELDVLAKLYEEVQVLREYLDSPNVRGSVKLDLLKKAYAKPWSKYFGNFLDLVMRKRRQEVLPYAAAAFNKYWDDYRSRIDVKVISAVELTGDQKDAISDKLAKRTGKNVILKCELDETLLGGIRLQIGHQLLDATIIGRLASLREELMSTR
ncbi:ATP synthase F1 subunit delta [candidate division LCP-89 bacterium B3_LCP]|uniref:ATP synthase subunit delta n=1 Tax=candidate division LCP-89 bacterium B3_LCP TaxID=2012998 RepID=A0A532UPR6_UNCL8|nr:MAG: ATP synthase F1 subunit delta [candidate division LCP-89 bacterium B3_LCP]